MAFSAKAYLKTVQLDLDRQLYRRAETQLPEEFAKLYKKNVVKITPKKTGRLRRSILAAVSDGRVDIGWRAPYARAQDEGGHTQTHTVRGINRRDGGGGTIKPGTYRYRRYTTPGTGPGFATKAFKATTAQMPALYREMGLTK